MFKRIANMLILSLGVIYIIKKHVGLVFLFFALKEVRVESSVVVIAFVVFGIVLLIGGTAFWRWKQRMILGIVSILDDTSTTLGTTIGNVLLLAVINFSWLIVLMLSLEEWCYFLGPKLKFDEMSPSIVRSFIIDAILVVISIFLVSSVIIEQLKRGRQE